MEIINYPSPNYFVGHGLRIQAIVLHGTAGSAESALQELTDRKPNNPDAAVSANYLITLRGTIYRLVPWWTGARAWANGIINRPDRNINWLMACVRNGINPNYCTISIEHEASNQAMLTKQPMPAAQLAASLQLTRKLLSDAGLQPSIQTVIGHCQIDSVNKANCPGVINIPGYIQRLQHPAVG